MDVQVRALSARPRLRAQGGVILDLYRGRFEGTPLRPDVHVICADEKKAIGARARIHPGSPPGPGRTGRVEHEYVRGGTLAYLAA